MALYTLVYIYANGVLLAENQTVDTALDANIPDVFTMVRNWAGVTPAPIVRTVKAAYVVPLPGVEFDYEQKMIDYEEVELMLQEGGSGKKCVTRGFFVGVQETIGVGQNTVITFDFRGTPSPFE